MRILTQLLLLATAFVLGAALAAATHPMPVVRNIVVEITGGPMGGCLRSPACRRAMDIPTRHKPAPDHGPYKTAPAFMDRA
jgi:hypothetical protein